MCDLNLENYWVVEVLMTPCDGWGDISETYQQNQEDLNEAFETIMACLFGDDEVGFRVMESDDGEGEEEDAVLVGPKRIELLLRGIKNETKEKRVVVTSLLPPSGRFSSTTVVGRVWKTYAHDLPKSMIHLRSDDYWISQIILHAGGEGGAVATYKFGKEAGKESAWHQLEGHYYKFKQPELTVVRAWDVGGKSEDKSPAHAGYWDDDDDVYGVGQGHSHYYQRVPSTYQPPTGYFRVRGDEVGAELFRTQVKGGMLEKSAPTLEELIDREKALKEPKPEAGDEKPEGEKKATGAGSSGTKGGSTTSTRVGSPAGDTRTAILSGDGTTRQVSSGATIVDAQYCDCGSPLCENCLWTEACERFGVDVNQLKHTVH